MVVLSQDKRSLIEVHNVKIKEDGIYYTIYNSRLKLTGTSIANEEDNLGTYSSINRAEKVLYDLAFRWKSYLRGYLEDGLYVMPEK